MNTWLSKLLQLVVAYIMSQQPGSAGVIASYDEGSDMASVILKPHHEPTGKLHVLRSGDGLRLPLMQGQLCWVIFDRDNTPAFVAGVAYNTVHVAPQAHLSVRGDAHIGPDVYLYGLTFLGVYNKLPTASAAYRFALVSVKVSPDGVAGTADVTYQCLQSATGSWSWKPVVSG